MGVIRTFGPVKLFTGVLVSETRLLEGVETRLVEEFGPIDMKSVPLPFAFTDYYRHETGDNIIRSFFAFETLIDAVSLPSIKHKTNSIEREFATSDIAVPRPANLDPGYMENAKVVLASAKNRPHRLYLGDGIFGEVTLHYDRTKGWDEFPWTYPDYKSGEYRKFFAEMRKRYREQLRSVCLVKQGREGLRQAPEYGSTPLPSGSALPADGTTTRD